MGSSSSKETKLTRDMREIKARNYPELFYKAIEAAQAGRYMVSEAYFHQVIEAHPAFDMYNGMLKEIGASLLSLETGRGYMVKDEGRALRLNSTKATRTKLPKGSKKAKSAAEEPADKDISLLSDGDTDTLMDVIGGDDLPNEEEEEEGLDSVRSGNTTIAFDDRQLRGKANPLGLPGKEAPLYNVEGTEFDPSAPSRTDYPTDFTESSAADRFDMTVYLDHKGEVVANFQQMMMDIEYIYLSCDTAKAHQLAMMYAQRNCVGFQATLYCVDDLLQERRRHENQGNGHRNRILDNDTANSIAADATKSRNTRYATEEDLEVILHQITQICRYFWISSATNYGHLALQHANSLDEEDQYLAILSSTTAKTQKEQDREKERRKRGKHRILVNVMENCEAIVELIREMANEAPTEYVNMVVLKVLPDVRKMRLERRRREVEESRVVSRATQSTDAASKVSGGASSKYGSSSNDQVNAEMLKARYAMLGIQKGSQSAISDSRNFTPALPILLPLDRIRLPMRLVPTVDQSNGPALKSDLANFTQPVERNCWQYNGWTIGEEGKQIIIYPAATHFLLAKALPQYYQADTTGYVKFHKTPIPGQSPPTSAYVDMLLDYVGKAKPQAELVKMAKTATTERHKEEESRPNRNLSLYDPQMRATVLTDEVAVCALPLYLLLGKVYKALGMAEESRLMARAVTLQTACFHGPDSSERWFMQDVVRREGLV